MFRPRSLQGLNSWPVDSRPVTPGRSPSPVQLTNQHDYSGAKRLDVPRYKVMKGRMLFIYHKVASNIGSDGAGQTVLAVVLLLVTVGLWLLYAHMAQQATRPRYMVILDGGSTGTRVHVFQYSADTRSSYAVLNLPEPKLKVEPGLSSYVHDPAAAATSLEPLLGFAKQHVPAQQRAETPVYLMATAGLRLVPAALAEDLLERCRATLSASGFLFSHDWASIISGTSEGLYSWIAANYAAGTLQAAVRNLRSRKEPKEPPSVLFKALIEMGGASAQVTFVPQHKRHSSGSSGSSTGNSVHLHLPGVTHPLWSHSYLGYGFDVVETKVIELVRRKASAGSKGGSSNATSHSSNSPSSSASIHPNSQPGAVSPGAAVMDPCLPAGYTSGDGRTGSGDWYRCQALVAEAIDPAKCKADARAAAEATCPKLPKEVPKLAGDLLAIENFAYTAHALNVPEHSSLGQFAAAARAFCSRPFPQTLQQHSKQHHQQRFLWRYCFGSAFAWTLLHDVLQLGEGQQLQFTNTLKSSASGQEVGLDWALGAAVLLLSRHGGAEGQMLTQQRQVVLLVLLAAIVATATVLTAAGTSVMRWWSASRGRRMLANKRFSDDDSGLRSGMGGVITFDTKRSGMGKHLYRTLPVSTSISE